jgi:hypothetical protein
MKNLKSSLRLIKEQTVKVYGRMELFIAVDTQTRRLSEGSPEIVRPIRQEGRLLLTSTGTALVRVRGVIDKQIAYTQCHFP